MRTAFILLFTAIIALTSAQEKYKKQVVGKLERKIFTKNAEFKKWFVKGYDAYKPDNAVVKILARELAGKKITIVLGTWCSDSQREIPRLFKVLDLANFDAGAIEILGLDRKKKAPATIISKYKITNVPTIIIYDATGKELGRIVETSSPTIEESLLMILSDK